MGVSISDFSPTCRAYFLEGDAIFSLPKTIISPLERVARQIVFTVVIHLRRYFGTAAVLFAADILVLHYQDRALFYL